MKIINKETKEKFEILGFISGNVLAPGLFSKAGTECCIVANIKTKEIIRIEINKLVKDYEYCKD